MEIIAKGEGSEKDFGGGKQREFRNSGTTEGVGTAKASFR